MEVPLFGQSDFRFLKTSLANRISTRDVLKEVDQRVEMMMMMRKHPWRRWGKKVGKAADCDVAVVAVVVVVVVVVDGVSLERMVFGGGRE